MIPCKLSTTCSNYRPRFDTLAWLLMFAIFGILVIMHNDVRELERRSELATAERNDIRAIATEQHNTLKLIAEVNATQTKVLTDVAARLDTSPSNVMREVKSIKQLLQENQELLKRRGWAASVTP